MKKWILGLLLSSLVTATVHSQLKSKIRERIIDTPGITHLPPVDLTGCKGNCPAGMTCKDNCCMYPTPETIGQLNYIIYNNCNAIKDLHFRFEVKSELTAGYDDEVSNCNASKVVKKLNTTQGIYFQFNCFSKDAPNALIQYIFAVTGTTITPHIQYSGGTPDGIDHDWLQAYTNAFGLTLAKANSLAKDYVLEVDLSTDKQGYVTGATFTVTDPSGKKYTQKAAKSGLYPVRLSEFQANIVSTNGNFVHFAKGGEGTLSYSSSGVICVEGGSVENCAGALGDYNVGTCETSNAVYGKLSSCCTTAGASFQQSVTVK